MTQRGRNGAVALVAAATMLVAGRANAQDEPAAGPGLRDATIVLHLVNYAVLSRDILDVARERVESVYKPIGVRIVWVDGERSAEQRQGNQLHLNILLLSREMAEKKISADGIKDEVLGQAHVSGGRASIFCDRIARTPGGRQYFPLPLGNIIAHEVGHLLLGVNSHSSSGIMRSNMDVRAVHLQSFEKTQAHAIRATLMEWRATPSVGDSPKIFGEPAVC